MKHKGLIRLFGLFALLYLVGISSAVANIEQAKEYKKAYGSMPKCILCHTAAVPKADAHDLNAYGQKVMGISATPTAETYTQAGKGE